MSTIRHQRRFPLLTAEEVTERINLKGERNIEEKFDTSH